MPKEIIALVFDFDDTLVPDSMNALLRDKGVDVGQFWEFQWKPLLLKGWDPTLAYLKLLIDLTQTGEALEGLTNQQLREFGSCLSLYRGLPEFFGQIRKDIQKLGDVVVEFWVISGGLEEVIKGCTLITSKVRDFWGCRLTGDTPTGPLKYITKAINFTEKTRYLFEISKGLRKKDTGKNPLLVNRYAPERQVPLSNMVYIGDGVSDIPCFSLVEHYHGGAIGVIAKDKHGKARREILKDLIRRTRGAHSPDYKKGSDLYEHIESAASIIIERLQGQGKAL